MINKSLLPYPTASIKSIKSGYNTVGDKVVYKPRLTNTQLITIKSLREQGLTMSQIQKETNICHVTISRVLAINDPNLDSIEYIDSLKHKSRAEWRVLGHQAGEYVTKDKFEKSSALQLVTIKAISEDKSRLIEGEVTQRIGFDDLTDSELEKKIIKDQDLLKRIEKGEVIETDILETGEDE